jgi:outer membrane protein OmpA-like peptidoglycan-associated protein
MQPRQSFVTLAAAGFMLAGASACATKGFVRNSVNDVNAKVETLSQSIENTQEATRQNQARIAEVDKKTTQVDQKADQVGLWAKDAQTAAANAGTMANAVGAKAEARADAIEASSRRLLFEVVLSEDQGNFKFGSSDLPDVVKGRIDEVIAQLKKDPRGNYVEIEGHTDATGDNLVNERIGLGRAEAVKRYLYEMHQVPLHKMNVISYGEEKPLAPNNTRDGRAQNRRVVIKILA